MNPFKNYNRIGGWICFAIATATYLLTMEPTTSLWDCAEFIATSYKLEVGHPPGAPLFMMIARFFTIFGPAEHAGLLVNTMSSIASGFTILFLFWTITLLALKWFGKKSSELSKGEIWAVIGAGAIGSLAYAFTDTFWFSAVEGEVYALSSFFTAIIFWAMLRWEQVADEPHSTRWLVLIAYLMGLSIGVHLLNLLAFPAMVFIYYFKKYPTLTRKGVLGAVAVSAALVIFVLYLLIPGTVALGAATDLLFVNRFGLPINSGMAVYAVALFVLLGWAVWYTHKKGRVLLNTILLMIAVVMLGYSSYASVIIRSAANPPMNSNNPDNPFGLMGLLGRDQYGSVPLLTGAYYSAPLIDFEEKTAHYVDSTGKYVPYVTMKDYVFPKEFISFFPRMHSMQPEHIKAYNDWGEIRGRQIPFNNGRQITQITVPTFGENLRFFFRYQVNFMYWRYFMWNFVGRQNDNHSTGSILDGNWISGFKAIDELYLGPQDNLPAELADNKARNRYFFLPFILGILGILTQLKRDSRGFTVVMWLFFMTGIAIILYLNQGPLEARERDYAFAGSFYAFAIWIGLGLLMVYDGLAGRLKDKRVAAGAATLLCSCVPVILAAQNWDDHDRSHRYVAADFGYNYLETALPGAIVMDYGDNDTFPLWYSQEVEGTRPDVRIMNLSYLSGAWYIDQMKLKANESDPVSFTLPQQVYTPINEQLHVVENPFGRPLTLRELIDGWIGSGNPLTFEEPSGNIPPSNLLPGGTYLLPVNKENAIAAGIVRPEDAHLMVDTIPITLKKSSITRSTLMLLDLLAHFDWKRPLYFTQPLNADEVGLTEYLQQDGFAYRLVPIQTPFVSGYGRIDTDYLYDKLMNKFRYGNVKDPRVNIDYYTRYSLDATQSRAMFGRLAEALVAQGDTLRAREVLARVEEEIPFSRLESTYYNTAPIIRAYYAAGETEKGNTLLTALAEKQKEYILYLLTFPEHRGALIIDRFVERISWLESMIQIAYTNGQMDSARDIDEFFLTNRIPYMEDLQQP
jgi:hypothetical protein